MPGSLHWQALLHSDHPQCSIKGTKYMTTGANGGASNTWVCTARHSNAHLASLHEVSDIFGLLCGPLGRLLGRQHVVHRVQLPQQHEA